jgi:hypothetical protein
MTKSGQSIAFDGSYITRHLTSAGVTEVHHENLYLNSYELGSISHGRNVRQRLGSLDIGGPFQLVKTEWQVKATTVDADVFVGPLIWEGMAGGWGDYNPPSSSTLLTGTALDSKGTTAIARSLPTNPNADLSTFVGELREGVPRAVGSAALKHKVQVARSAGSEYLNVEFGWKPLLRDLQSFATSVKKHNKILASYKKGSDKKIRRRYLYPPEQTVTVGHGAYAHSQTGAFAFGTRTYSKKNSMWFSGAFRYHVPIPDNTWGKLQKFESDANKLLGTRVTPETVWNVAPWSWAGDWFGTTGDVLHNISHLGHDGLVMEYGYMMSESIDEDVKAATQQGGPLSSLVRKTVTIKQRRPATPFGFGVDMHALTGKQTAILVALGLSRS